MKIRVEFECDVYMIRSIDALNYTCSECESEGRYTPYCAYCGADMMEDNND